MSTRSTSPTMKDVAKKAGVSSSTVSRILSGSDCAIPISQATRQRVIEVVQEMGYRPNPFALALRKGETKLLGVILRDIDDPFFARLVKALSGAVRLQGYNLILGDAHSSPDVALILSGILDARHCAGIFLLGDIGKDRGLVEEVHRHHRWVVAVCRAGLPTTMPAVAVDNRSGVLMALDYLEALGHSRIAFLDGGRLGDIRERRSAFENAMAPRELNLLSQYVQTNSNDPPGGYQAMQRLLALENPPTAVLCSDDMMALGALQAAAHANVRVPDDVSVVGFDDLDVAHFTVPALTTVRQPVDEIAVRASGAMMALLADKPATGQPREILLQPELVVRHSTGPEPTRR